MRAKYNVITGSFDEVVHNCHVFLGTENLQTTLPGSGYTPESAQNFYPYDNERPLDIGEVVDSFNWKSGFTILNALTCSIPMQDRANLNFMYVDSVSGVLCCFCLLYSKTQRDIWVACHIHAPNLSPSKQIMHLFSPQDTTLLPMATLQAFDLLCNGMIPQEYKFAVSKHKMNIQRNANGHGSPISASSTPDSIKYTPEKVLLRMIDPATGKIISEKELRTFKSELNPLYKNALKTLATHWTYRYFSPAPNLQAIRINPAICVTSIALAGGLLIAGNLSLSVAVILTLVCLLSMVKTYQTFKANEAVLEQRLSL